MNTFFRIALVGACLVSTAAQAEKLYKWIDRNGVVHYGDAVPAEHSALERHVLNEQGVAVDVLPRARTHEELAAEAAAAAEDERRRIEAVAQAERDRNLLDTYLSVDEIASLRDRRILALDAQIGVTRHYLKGLEERWNDLEAEARKYNFPYDEESDAPALPDDIAQHLIHTEKSMAEHMQTVKALRREQSNIRDEFERDISRFMELKASLADL